MQKRVLAKISVVIFLISVFAFSVSAQSNNASFDASKSFEWLIQQCEGGWCGNVETTAVYAMAVKLAGYSNTYGAQAIKQIQLEEKESESCFPKASCNPRDTAFAYWVLSNYGEDTSSIEGYLRSNLGVGLKDNWWLQVITTAENKECKIGYLNNGQQDEFNVMVDNGKFPECNAGQPDTFFDLNSCIIPNLVNSNPSLELTIDCSSIGEGTVISIVYNSGSSYYLTEQATTAKYKTQIQNACHKSGSSCDKDASLWANWVLKNKNSDINTNLYLLTNYDNLNPVDLSLLYLTTSDATVKSGFINDLLVLQKLDGSFNKDDYGTAISLLALNVAGSSEEISNAVDYLKKSRKADGSWSSDEKTTAWVLYSAFADASVTLPPMPGSPGGSSSGDLGYCGDGVCGPDESVYSCLKDCQQESSDSCVTNGICESDYGETSVNCPTDCSCGDGICDSTEKGVCSLDCGSSVQTQPVCGNNVVETGEQCDGIDSASCTSGYSCGVSCVCVPDESSSNSNINWMIWSVIITVLLALGIYFAYAYTKSHGSKKKSSSYSSGASISFPPMSGGQAFGHNEKPLTKQPGSSTRETTRKSDAERELEKSLREAKRLLGGK